MYTNVHTKTVFMRLLTTNYHYKKKSKLENKIIPLFLFTPMITCACANNQIWCTYQKSLLSRFILFKKELDKDIVIWIKAGPYYARTMDVNK